MTTAENCFSRTNRIYENVRRPCLTRHEIELPPASRLIRASARLFQMLDRDEPIQAEISRKLWVLRSTILFTVLPFDHPALNLQQQLVELENASGGLPNATPLLESIRREVSELASLARNPKREWLLKASSETDLDGKKTLGILSALSAGRAPGWPPNLSDLIPVANGRVVSIKSKKDLTSSDFEAIVLPCGCRNAPPSLLSCLLHSGWAAKYVVLLYPGEIFHAPKRLTLPADRIFDGRLAKIDLEQERIVIAAKDAQSVVDAWINEAFWQGLHGAARANTNLSGHMPANYVLFSDGTGAFFHERGSVLSLPENGVIASEGDLRSIPVDGIQEGDLVVLRSGASGILLDEASDRILGSAGNESLFEMATDWKDALDALLVTHSCEEVAQALAARGAPTRGASIHQWTGPDVLGPGSERVFRELIALLAEKGKIPMAGTELQSYSDSCWKSLQGLRGVRHKAGNLIRQELFTALFNRFGSGNCRVADRESIHIEGDTETELLVLRVSSVDRNVAYVPPWRIGQMDDLKENRWLG